jgi:hypothetical protein
VTSNDIGNYTMHIIRLEVQKMRKERKRGEKDRR